MPMDFPDFDSLKQHAECVGFRQPLDTETDSEYRNALADFVQPMDMVEAGEIRTGRGWDKQSPEEILAEAFAAALKNR